MNPDAAESATVRLRPLEPVAVGPSAAAAMVGMSRAMFYKQMAAGRVGPQGRRFGKVVRFSVDELRAWAAAGMPDRATWTRQREAHP